MTDEENLRLQIRRDLHALEAEAPPPHLARLWHHVRAKRQRRLEHRLALATAMPTLCLLIGGIVSVLLGNSWHVAAPCVAVAFWLGPQAFGAALETGNTRRAI
jgi:type VI protein secretion system component VasF